MTTTGTTTLAIFQRWSDGDWSVHVHELGGRGYDRVWQPSDAAAHEYAVELIGSGCDVQCWCGCSADHWETGASSDAAVPGPRCGDHAQDAEPLDADALDADALDPDRVEEAETGPAAQLVDALDAELVERAQRFADVVGAAIGLAAPVRVRVARLRRSASGALVRGEYAVSRFDRFGEHLIGLDVRTPRGVRPYVLAHELVHALQAERAARRGSTFRELIAPEMARDYGDRVFEREARTVGLAVSGALLDADPLRGARRIVREDGGAGLDAQDLRGAAELIAASLDRVEEATGEDDPADAALDALALAGLAVSGERVCEEASDAPDAESWRLLVVSDAPYVEREIVIGAPAGATRERVERAASRWLASPDCPPELVGFELVMGADTFPLDRVEERASGERVAALREETDAAAVEPVWCSRLRADVTFSLADPDAASGALGVALDAVAATGSGGATVAGPLVGYWRGAREDAYRVELIGGDAHGRALAIAAELVERTSCEAIQVETWSDGAYRAREVRAREERVEEAERAATGPERRAAAVRLARHLRDAAQLAEDGAPASALAVARAAADDWRAVVHGAPERVCEAAALAPVAGRSAPLGARSGRVVAPELARLDAAAQRALAALDRRPSPRQLARLRRTCTAALAARLDGASPETVAAGRSWYPSAQLAVERIAARTGLAADRVAAAVAALSPRKHWADNLRAAERLAVAVAAGAEPPSVHFGRQQAAALGALRGELAPEEAATGPKVAPFRRAISGDPSALVLDTWAARAAGLPESALTRRPVRAVLVEAYGLAADAAGLAVRDAQAVAWLAVRGVVPSDPDGFRVEEAERVAANLAPGVSTAHAHFYPPDDPPPYLVCEDPACGYGADADSYRYEEDPQCPRCASPLDPAEELPAERVEEAARAIAVELSPSSYLPAARRAIVGAVSYRRRAIRVEPHEHGPRVYVLDRRVHHGPPALLAAAVLIGAGRYRAASVALLWAAEDARDFPWTDGRNHAPGRRAIRPLRVLVSLTLTTLTARSDRS